MKDKKFYLCKNKKTKSWYIYVYDYDENGKRFKERSFSTRQTIKSLARDKLNKYIQSLENQEKEQMKSKNITLSNFYKETKQHLSNNLSKSTINIYNLTIRKFLELIADKPIRLITASDIEKFKELRLNTNVSKYMVNKEFSCLRALFNIAIKLNYLLVNPCRFVRKYTITEKKMLAFNDDEIELILNNIRNISLLHIVKFATITGLRLSEILNLQVKDIDYKEGIINITNKENFTTKNKKNKICILTRKLKELLNEILDINLEQNISSLNTLLPERYLFHPPNRNSPYHSSYISHLFKKELRKHPQISEHLHFHSIRHHYITKKINQGVPLNYVSLLVFHSSINTTMNYIHLNRDELTKYAEY